MVKKLIAAAILALFMSVDAHSQRTLMDYNYLNRTCGFSCDSTWFVIDTEEDFDQMSDCNLPFYDFTKHSILGIRGKSQSHSVPEVEIRLYRDDTNKVYTVEATVFGGRACTNCRVMRPDYQRAIETEKLRMDYLIDFNVQFVYEEPMPVAGEVDIWRGEGR